MTQSKTLAVLIAFHLVRISATWAAMPESIYQEALAAAQKKAHRLNQNRIGAVSSSTLKHLFGRYYKVGDSWDVAAWQFNHSLIPLKRQRETPDQAQIEIGSRGLFHYEVVSLKPTSSSQVTVKITQRSTSDFPLADSNVEQLNLVFSDQLTQAEKIYFFRGFSQGIHVSPEGIRSRISPLELFPLDVPDIATAEKSKRETLPILPTSIHTFANKFGFRPDLTQCSWFEQEDFFGRAVQVLWQQGDPWPTYIRTVGGIALLVHRSNL